MITTNEVKICINSDWLQSSSTVRIQNREVRVIADKKDFMLRMSIFARSAVSRGCGS